MPVCRSCRQLVSDSARFCEHCGAPIDADGGRPAGAVDRVRQLVAAGQKIEAIKVLREATGAGLAEAKRAVEAIERGEWSPSAIAASDSDLELLQLFQERGKIAAIKLHRERTGAGLKESKDFVEALAVQHGIEAPRGGCLGVLAFLVVTLIVAGVGASIGVSAVRADDSTKFSAATKSETGWLVHRVESPRQAGPTEIHVLLPDQMLADTRYPVLYVLPVEAMNEQRYGDGLAEVRRCDLHNKFGLICVRPTFFHLPWYADHPTDTSIRQESYFVNDVVPFIDRTYAARPERDSRWLLGFSKSGWGAWSLLARHPDLFGRASAWDAPLDMRRFDLYGAGPIFGTQEHFETYRVLPALQKCETLANSAPRLVLTGYDNFRNEHVTAHQRLDEWKIPHVYRDGPKRKHVWTSGWVEEAVELLAGLDSPTTSKSTKSK
jgi:ribosomal protein L7/L12